MVTMDANRISDTASAEESEWEGLPEFRCSSLYPIAMTILSVLPVDTGLEDRPVPIGQAFQESEDFRKVFCERVQALSRLIFPFGAPPSLTPKAASLAAWILVSWQVDRSVPDLLETLDDEWTRQSARMGLDQKLRSESPTAGDPARKFLPMESILESLTVPEEPLDLQKWIDVLYREGPVKEPSAGPVGMNF